MFMKRRMIILTLYTLLMPETTVYVETKRFTCPKVKAFHFHLYDKYIMKCLYNTFLIPKCRVDKTSTKLPFTSTPRESYPGISFLPIHL